MNRLPAWAVRRLVPDGEPSTRLPLPVEVIGLVAAGAILVLIGSGSSSASLSLLTSAAVFGIAATSLGFLWGQSGQVNLGHAAVFGVGAYTAALLSRNGLGFYVTLPLSALAGAIAAGIFAAASLRVSGHYFVILTFALGEVAVTVGNRLTEFTGGLAGLTLVTRFAPFESWGMDRDLGFYLLCVVVLVVALVAIRIAMRSSWGTTLRGIRDNHALARSLGRDDLLHKFLAFLVSGAVAGVGGQFYVYQVQYIAPSMFGVSFGLLLLVMVLLGGRATLLGPAVGAIAYQLLPELTGGEPLVTQMILGVILIVLILFVPDGIVTACGNGLSRIVRRFAGNGEDTARDRPRQDEVAVSRAGGLE